MLPADVTLTPVTDADFSVLLELAGTIWRQHYAGIVSVDQIDRVLPSDNRPAILMQTTRRPINASEA